MLHTRKLRPGEIKQLAKGHVAGVPGSGGCALGRHLRRRYLTIEQCLVVVRAVLTPTVTHGAPTAFYHCSLEAIIRAKSMRSERSSDLPIVTGTSIRPDPGSRFPERPVAPGELAEAGSDHR